MSITFSPALTRPTVRPWLTAAARGRAWRRGRAVRTRSDRYASPTTHGQLIDAQMAAARGFVR